MSIDKIDYSKWLPKDFKLAEKCDKDNIKGLNGREIFDFAREAYENEYNQEDIFNLLGLSINKTQEASNAKVRRSESTKACVSRNYNPDFEKAVDYYNNEMSFFQKYEVTSLTYDNVQERLYNMEKGIDNALSNCQAYKDIVIVPRSYYRYCSGWSYYYHSPSWSEMLTNFDIEDLRTMTTNDMNSLNELRENVEAVIEKANGGTEKAEPKTTEYDVDKLAQKHLGMSYEEFEKKYKTQLERFKNITLAEIAELSPQDKVVYDMAKNYAKEMIQTTVIEAHTANWDIGERKTEEALKVSNDMFAISEFEYEDITEEGLSQIKSGILYKAFEDALISKHREFDPTAIKDVRGENKAKGAVKYLNGNRVEIEHPDGSVYDTTGKRIK